MATKTKARKPRTKHGRALTKAVSIRMMDYNPANAEDEKVLVKAGLFEKRKDGKFYLTPLGRTELAKEMEVPVEFIDAGTIPETTDPSAPRGPGSSIGSQSAALDDTIAAAGTLSLGSLLFGDEDFDDEDDDDSDDI